MNFIYVGAGEVCLEIVNLENSNILNQKLAEKNKIKKNWSG